MRYHKITQKNNNNKNNSKILSVTLLFSKLLPPNPLIATEVITDGPLFSKKFSSKCPAIMFAVRRTASVPG